MVLVLSLMGLAMVSALLFMVTQSTRMSGYHRFFRTAEDAGLGGAEIGTEFIKTRGALTDDLIDSLSPLRNNDACLAQKLNMSRGGWTSNLRWTSCGSARLTLDLANDANNYDMTFNLSNFRVLVKIVDTVEGNSDTGGLVTDGGLGGKGVVEASSGMVNPAHNPYLYRMEIQAEEATNPRERAKFSGLYAY